MCNFLINLCLSDEQNLAAVNSRCLCLPAVVSAQINRFYVFWVVLELVESFNVRTLEKIENTERLLYLLLLSKLLI